MNRAQFRDWALAQGSVAKYNDGLYKGECVSLINQYCYRVLGIPADAWGHAKEWATGAALKYFDRVGTLQDGDVLVYPATATNPYGHIEIYLGGGMSLQQNRFYNGRVGVNATMDGYTAIRKKGTTQATKPKESKMLIGSGENWYARCNDTHIRIRGRELKRETWKGFIGVDFLHFVETCSDDKEAQVVQQWQETGKIAVRDKWSTQIADLKKQVGSLNKRPTQAQLDALKTQVAKLDGDMAIAQQEATQAKKDAAKSTEELAKNLMETEKAEKEASNFLTALINAVRKMFGGK